MRTTAWGLRDLPCGGRDDELSFPVAQEFHAERKTVALRLHPTTCGADERLVGGGLGGVSDLHPLTRHN